MARRKFEDPYGGTQSPTACFVGAEFRGDDTGGKKTVRGIRDQGVVTLKAGRNGNVLHLLPSLVATRDWAKRGLDITVGAIEMQAERAAADE